MKKKHSIILLPVCALCLTGMPNCAAEAAQSQPKDTLSAEIVIRTDENSTPISPYIYGINDNGNISGTKPTVLKQCGAALSSYNWETNFSNTGIEGMNTNGIALIEKFPDSQWNDPALYTDNLITNAFLYDIPVKLVNLQLMGYTAKDAMGVVSDTDNIEDRWDRISFRKGDSYLNIPNTADGTVYIDEYAGYLINKYGTAAEGGINGYFLDSEPDKWNENFPVLKLGELDPDELIKNSAELSAAVNLLDSEALVFGPSVSGVEAASDLNGSFSSDISFINYYLSRMKAASHSEGIRLLDVLDIHYFISPEESYSDADRIQAVRALFDPEYTAANALYKNYGKNMPVIPFLKKSAENYFPNTKLSFSEYSFGGGDSIVGCIAEADALGIFAENEIYLACLLPDKENCAYQKSALNIYTDYDGKGSKFGNTLLSSTDSDSMSSCYASRQNNDNSLLTVMLINKNRYNDKDFSITLDSSAEYKYAEVYAVKSDSPQIIRLDNIEDIYSNSFNINLDPNMVCLIALYGETPDEPENEQPPQTTPAQTSAVSSVTENRAEHTIEIITTGTAPVYETTVSETAKTSASSETSAKSRTETEESITETTPPPDVPPAKDEPEFPPVLKVVISFMAASCFGIIIYILFLYK